MRDIGGQLDPGHGVECEFRLFFQNRIDCWPRWVSRKAVFFHRLQGVGHGVRVADGSQSLERVEIVDQERDGVRAEGGEEGGESHEQRRVSEYLLEMLSGEHGLGMALERVLTRLAVCRLQKLKVLGIVLIDRGQVIGVIVCAFLLQLLGNVRWQVRASQTRVKLTGGSVWMDEPVVSYEVTDSAELRSLDSGGVVGAVDWVVAALISAFCRPVLRRTFWLLLLGAFELDTRHANWILSRIVPYLDPFAYSDVCRW